MEAAVCAQQTNHGDGTKIPWVRRCKSCRVTRAVQASFALSSVSTCKVPQGDPALALLRPVLQELVLSQSMCMYAGF